MAREALLSLGFDAAASERAMSLFKQHDERQLEAQYAVQHDEAQLIQSAKEAAEQLQAVRADRAQTPSGFLGPLSLRPERLAACVARSLSAWSRSRSLSPRWRRRRRPGEVYEGLLWRVTHPVLRPATYSAPFTSPTRAFSTSPIP